MLVRWEDDIVGLSVAELQWQIIAVLLDFEEERPKST